MNCLGITYPPQVIDAQRPTVSVIVPTYNREQWVGDAVHSILNQDFSDLEVLVLDDNSKDDTSQVIKNINDSRVKYFRNAENLGVPGNVNQGICKAKGHYIFIFHDSDIADPTIVKKMYGLLINNPSVVYVHTGIEFVDKADRQISVSVGNYSQVTSGRDWLLRMLCKLNSEVSAITMASRKVYEQYGLFDSAYGFYADVEWAIRLCLQGDIGYVNQPLVIMRERENDHPFSQLRWETFIWSIEMREKYLSNIETLGRRALVRTKLSWNIETALTIAMLSCVKHRDMLKLRQGKMILKEYGRFLPRLVSGLM